VLDHWRGGMTTLSYNSFPYKPIDEESERKSTAYVVFKYCGVIAGVTLLSALVYSNFNDNSVQTFLGNFAASKALGATENDVILESNFAFTLHRSGYDPLAYFTDNSTVGNIVTYKMLENYGSIIEPYADMNIYIPDLDTSKSFHFRFTACPYDSSTKEKDTTNCELGEYKASQSRPLTVACKAGDEYFITVNQYSADDGTFLRNSTGFSLCMYVRREMSALTSSDLSTTMDAMYALWSVSDEDGLERYGENFHSSTWFARGHMFNAAQRDSDHIHEGLGFLTQHIKLTNLYELAIQSVNPSISLPYWDYTTESGDLSESIMFSADTFGSVTYPAETCCWTYTNDSMVDAAIPDGRWAFTKADLHNSAFTDLSNAFGYLRGPWNTNPSPYISRFTISHTSLPTCSAYYKWVQLTDLGDFFDLAPFAPHASTHGAIGGVFGCDIFDPLMADGLIRDDSSRRRICKKWSIILKELYRSNFISPKANCTATSYDYTGVSCGYECVEQDSSAMQSSLKNLITTQYVPEEMTQEGWNKWRDFVCTGDGNKVFSGDQLEAASPSDPSFWPIHPNLERLFQAKLMAGGFETSVWATDPSDVCDKAKCYEEEFGDKGYYTQCCKGHYEDDQLLDFVNGDIYSGYGPTNAEIMTWTDPTRTDYTMPYIYDDFSWSHCEEDFSEMYFMLSSGIDMSQIVADEDDNTELTQKKKTQSYWVEDEGADEETEETS